jgi:hypothetical protein
MLVYLIFILLNQDTRGVVSLGFMKFEGIHTYIITFFAFGAGVVTAEIFSIIARLKRRKKRKNLRAAETASGTMAGAEAASVTAAEKNIDVGKE